jgi:hypothetical protein
MSFCTKYSKSSAWAFPQWAYTSQRAEKHVKIQMPRSSLKKQTGCTGLLIKNMAWCCDGLRVAFSLPPPRMPLLDRRQV